MKKRYAILAGGLLMLLAASLLLGMIYLNHDGGKRNKATVKESDAPKGQATATESDASEKPIRFNVNLSVSWSHYSPMEGWFIEEHLKEKFGIEVWQADASRGGFDGTEEGIELCWLQSYTNFYDAVKEGKLRNLEDEIKEHPEVYRRYRKAIKKIKADTYKNTGKKGVFGIPSWLSSFDDTGIEGVCVVVPANAPHPELALELLTYSASDEGIMNIAFGPEGQMWKKENGKYVLLQDGYQINDENPGKKFVKTKSGMVDFGSAICPLELVGNVGLGRELLKRSSGKNKATVKESDAPKGQATVAESDASEKPIRFYVKLSAGWSPNSPMKGWFIEEHLKEKFGIEVWQADTFRSGFDESEEDIELCWLQSYTNFYDAVKGGKLRNLEDEIKKHPKVYRRYRKAIKKIKADTYKNTGKKGVFGIPTWLSSFDDTGIEGYCVVVPANAPHPKLALELLTYSASNEGIMNIAFGPEGQMWKEENGKYVLLQDWYQINDENPGKKVVKTKSGMEDRGTAICPLELVGNVSLGRELLKRSSGKTK